MCGLSGYISKTSDKNLEQSLEALSHRGPDASGIWRTKEGAFYLGFGHVRLSILDLTDESNQPFLDTGYSLIFNGEIYNYQEIRTELEELGLQFKTKSDTEVILQSYKVWGLDCIPRFEGMFAFAIADLEKKQVILARDRLGIKPLYYYHDQDEFIFSSEIRGLSPVKQEKLALDQSQYAEFLLNGWLYEPKTGFKDVEKVPPGYCFVYDLDNGRVEKIEYYNPLTSIAPNKEIEFLISESLKLQSLADVRLGLFFSGGVDSSVLALASKGQIDGLFVKYDDAEGQDDSVYALEIASNINMPVETIRIETGKDNPAAILDDFRRVAANTEEPISDFTFLATERIAAKARENGYKVMLSGMGGDELFAGYPRYQVVKNRRLVMSLGFLIKLFSPVLRKIPALAKKADRLLRFSTQTDFFKAYTSLIGYFSPSEVNRLLKDNHACDALWQWGKKQLARLKNLSPLKKAMYFDRLGFLPHNLMVTDKASMLQSIEVRVPLMSNELADFGFHSKDSQLIDRNTGKKPLKQMLLAGLPAELINRKKVGFNPPLDGKINNLGKDLILNTLNSGPVSSICDMNVVKEIVNNHFSGNRNETYKIWQLMYFNFWLEHNSK
ncbi:asparagine synthase (glutamine-hydrolyzing) [Legionella dresdenensis]|uniref:asparagine synthase (glutamine-hydrolyzing) n=1 Tax=Legionella dresdenensis TaxID=450200 RepID=A0ABV8CDB8_9GAMM